MPLTDAGLAEVERPRRRRLCRFVLLLLCAPLAATADDGSATAFYRGEINADNNRGFFERVGDQPVRRLVVDSPGGEVSAGIALGLWIFTHDIEVEVEQRCLSSCANYVFTAGRRKRIRPGAVVAWHGNYHHLQATGLWTDDIGPRMARTGEDRSAATAAVERQMRDLVRREREFFRLIDVDPYLCWVGKAPPHSVPNYFTLDIADMARFGVHSVIVDGDYRATDLARFDEDIRWVDP